MSSPSSVAWAGAGLLFLIVVARLAFVAGFEAGERTGSLRTNVAPSCDLGQARVSPREALCDAIIDQVGDLVQRERVADEAQRIDETTRD